jgi:hypothetical protein
MKTNNVERIVADEAFISAVRGKIKGLENAWFETAKQKGVDGPRVLTEMRDEITKVASGK